MLVVLPAPLTPTTMITVGCGRRRPDKRLLQRRQQGGERLGQQPLHGRRIGGLGVLDAALQVGQQELGGRHAGVGHQQRRFELFVQRLVDARAGEDLGDARCPSCAGPAPAGRASRCVAPAGTGLDASAGRPAPHGGAALAGSCAAPSRVTCQGRGITGATTGPARRGGFGRLFLKKLNIGFRNVVPSAFARAVRLAIMSGSGALAQLVRATES
jgi:hypothetical protein